MPDESGKPELPPVEPFVVMAKPVGPACNLACEYCYYLETGEMYSHPHRFRMTEDLLEKFISRYLTAAPGPEVLFVWHGGEPVLAGIDFFRKAVELQNRHLPQGKTCRNNLQTNGTLLDDDWCRFLAENHFDVGLSIDGAQRLHDVYRRDRLGRGSYNSAEAAVRRLQEHGIQPDLLCTVTSAIAKEPLITYRALREFDTGWIQFIPIVRRRTNGLVTPESVTGEEYGRFLSAVFNEWVHHDIDRLQVQFFAEMSLVWSGGHASLCWMAPTCGRALIVEHDGRVYSCDHFVNGGHLIGNIVSSSLADLAGSPVQRRFGEAKRDTLPRQCRACSWLDVCNGGCPRDRFLETADGEPGMNYLCGGLRLFFAYAEKPLKKVIERRRRGVKPEAVMAELKAELAARWKGVGRNDPCPCGSGRKAKHCCWYLRQ